MKAVRNERRAREEQGRVHYWFYGLFEKKRARIAKRLSEDGRYHVTIVYGGEGEPQGPGAGRVERFEEETGVFADFNFYQLPAAEGALVVVDRDTESQSQ